MKRFLWSDDVNEPLCLDCKKKITEEAIEAFNNSCFSMPMPSFS